MKGKQAPGVQPSKASDLITAPCVSERPSRGRAYVSGFGGRAGTPQNTRIKRLSAEADGMT